MDRDRAREFEVHRPRLLAVAYRMTGSVADAEDLVQDAYERWSKVEEEVNDPRAYLTTTLTRLCVDHHRSARVRRERYVGPWLPEPVLGEAALGAEAATELAADVSMALMMALEKLSALERAAFLLHDVFDVPFERVAGAIGRSEAASRKLAARAREALRSETRPRRRASLEEGRRIVRAFLGAVGSGDVTGLGAMLAEDAVLYSDGGGRVKAALRPIAGRDRIARFFVGVARFKRGVRVEPCLVNGEPGAVVHTDEGLDQIVAFEIASSGAIDRIYSVRNPEKLARITPRAAPERRP